MRLSVVLTHKPGSCRPTMTALIEDRARRYLRHAISHWRCGDEINAWRDLGVAEGQVLALYDTPRDAYALQTHVDRVRRVFSERSEGGQL